MRRITGTAGYVLDGAVADLVVVAARDGQGVGLYVVDGDADGLTRTPLTTMDSTRRLARLDFQEAPAVLVGTDVAEPIARAFDIALLLLAAEQVGGARAALDSAVEYARHGIRANSLCPGPIETPLLAELLAHPARRQRRLTHIPIGRFGRPEEIARAALFLASDDASFVTGSSMVVDGGITAAYVTPE